MNILVGDRGIKYMNVQNMIEKLYSDIQELELNKKNVNSEISIKALDTSITRKKKEIRLLREGQVK